MYAKSQEDLLDKSEINIVHDLIPFNVLTYFSIYLVLRNSMYNNHLPYYKERTTEDLDKGIKRYVILVTYLKRFGSHRALPVGLIAKNSSEITDYINESKNEPTWKFKFRIKLLKMTLNLVMGLFCGLLRPRLGHTRSFNHNDNLCRQHTQMKMNLSQILRLEPPPMLHH